MSKKPTKRNDYAVLLGDIKDRIRESQTRAVLAVNAELIRLYWDIGRMLAAKQKQEGWGSAVIPRLAKDLKNELPEVKGFSERNIGRMIRFFKDYSQPETILPAPVAKMRTDELPPDLAHVSTIDESLLWSIPWYHHLILQEKVKDLDARIWYMRKTLECGWSRNILAIQIDIGAHARHGKVTTNFAAVLPAPQSDLVQQALKDPYIFDFLTLTEPFQERELETALVNHVQQFLMELGQGFSFVGRQYRVEVGDDDFYIDLLFYHLRLRAFVVIDLLCGGPHNKSSVAMRVMWRSATNALDSLPCLAA